MGRYRRKQPTREPGDLPEREVTTLRTREGPSCARRMAASVRCADLQRRVAGGRFCFERQGIATVQGYRQAGVNARLAMGGAVLGLLILTRRAGLPQPRPRPHPHQPRRIHRPGVRRLLRLASSPAPSSLSSSRSGCRASSWAHRWGWRLGVAGATMQGLFRNPMADPGIIGVSTGGAVGAVVAIATGATGPVLPRAPDIRLRGRSGGDLPRVRDCSRRRPLLHGDAAARRRGRQRVPRGHRLRHHHPVARQRSACARSSSGLPAASTPARGSTCAFPRRSSLAPPP